MRLLLATAILTLVCGCGILEELDGIPTADQEKVLYSNVAALNERRPL